MQIVGIEARNAKEATKAMKLEYKKHIQGFSAVEATMEDFLKVQEIKKEVENAQVKAEQLGEKLEDLRRAEMILLQEIDEKSARTSIAGNEYKLTVNASPKDAEIQFIGSVQKYKPSIKLKPSTYSIRVSKYKYRSETFKINVSDKNIIVDDKKFKTNIVNKHMTINVKLTKAYYPFYVNTSPRDARVKITNIPPKYKRGMRLEPGSYKIKVYRKGYYTRTRWVTIENRKKIISVVLGKRQSPKPVPN